MAFGALDLLLGQRFFDAGLADGVAAVDEHTGRASGTRVGVGAAITVHQFEISIKRCGCYIY
jgi:hypothetical protein